MMERELHRFRQKFWEDKSQRGDHCSLFLKKSFYDTIYINNLLEITFFFISRLP